MNNNCPKCGKKLSPFYFKQNCPACGVNLLFYDFEENLKNDAQKANAEVERAAAFGNKIKASSFASPLLIIRFILFFTPLLSMLLPMYRVSGGKSFGLLIFIKSLIEKSLSFGDIFSEITYTFSFFAICFVVVLSLAVIISSLFSVGKTALRRNIVFSLLNTAVFLGLSIGIAANGGALLVGFYLTLAIYIAETAMHIFADKKIN